MEEPTGIRATTLKQSSQNPVLPLDSIPAEQETRIQCAIEELDRVLGGGLVPGSVVLVGGDPGIGKSTLMLQSMGALASQGLEVLYVSGEESVRQIRMRSERLDVSSSRIFVLAETCLEFSNGILSVDQGSLRGFVLCHFENQPSRRGTDKGFIIFLPEAP